MRILALLHQLPYPANNGARLRTFHLLRELARHHDLAVLSPSGPDSALERFQEQLGSSAQVDAVEWPPISSRELLLAYFSPRPRDILQCTRGSAAWRTVRGWLARWSPDVLWVSDPILGEYVDAAADPRRVVDIAAEYNLYIERAARLGPPPGRLLWRLRGLKWAGYTRRLGPQVDLWAVPSEVDRATLLRYLPPGARVHVIPNGIDTQANRYDFRSDTPPRIVFSGALSYEPNLDGLSYFLREIWPRVLQEADAQLFITGDPRLAPAEARRAPRVTLTGYLPEVRTLLANCRASVAPLRIGVGTRLKILEALAVGTPVVATSVGAEGLEVVHGEHLLLGNDPASFADRIVALLQSSELRARLSRAGRELVEQRYAWSAVAASLNEALRDLQCEPELQPRAVVPVPRPG